MQFKLKEKNVTPIVIISFTYSYKEIKPQLVF